MCLWYMDMYMYRSLNVNVITIGLIVIYETEC